MGTEPLSNTDADSLPSPTLPRAYRLGRAVRWLAGLTIILSLIGLWQAEQRTVDHDLQLVAERSASPGARIAIRALLLSGLQGVDGPRLQGRPVDIQLRAASGEVVAGTTLRVTPNQTMEGVLALPDDAEGRYMLEGRVQLADGVRVTCGRDLEIAPGAGTPRRFLRIAGPLQHFSQGPVVRAETELQPPEMLEMRVLGGACVPEYPCDLGVWVGEPGASLSLRLPSSVDQLQPGQRRGPGA